MTLDKQLIETLAAGLREAAATGRPVPPLRDSLASSGIAGAYAVQQANTRFALAGGRRIVGRKIGLTSRAVQAQLGVDSPDYGVLLDDMALYDGEDIAAGRVLQPKVEAEVAFVLGRDLTQPNVTPAEVIRATEFVLPAIEIVGSRIADWNIKLLDTVADNASSGLFVVGNEPRLLRQVDLRTCGMVMSRRGDEVSTGTGAACLGHPVNALVWLARKLVEVGEPLREGDLVMSGALGPMAKAEAGDLFEARIEGLGSVRVAFAA
ncbi:MAG TPA: 2-keto-4-pentenoate hydratase [Ramlibacter sp.]|nr:2-keto-4-pentenoate hydratase [Ramlibacter sp.]